MITFLSTLLLHAEARVVHETDACVTVSMKGRSSLVAGEDFQGMFLTVGIGILLGFAVGVLCLSGWEKMVTWPSWLVMGRFCKRGMESDVEKERT